MRTQIYTLNPTIYPATGLDATLLDASVLDPVPRTIRTRIALVDSIVEVVTSGNPAMPSLFNPGLTLPGESQAAYHHEVL